MQNSQKQFLVRYGSLALLVIQNCSAVLLMRYTQSPTRQPFSIPIANLAVEIVKFVLCAGYINFSSPTANSPSASTSNNTNSSNSERSSSSEKDKIDHDEQATSINSSSGWNALKQSIFQKSCLQMAVPATLFTIQNNLLFVALANLDATLFQVTYQLKLLCTALLMVIMLGKELQPMKWFSLFLLFCGIVLTQLKPKITNKSDDNNDSVTKMKKSTSMSPITTSASTQSIISTEYYPSEFLTGMFAVVTCAMCSAFASVYFEKILKTSPAAASSSIAVRNVQLAIFSFGLNLFVYWLSNNSNSDQGNSIFAGFDSLVWCLVLVQAAGGLLVAVVIKFCDNILKTFATSIAIIVNGVVSYVWLQFEPSGMFLLGAFIVMVSTTLYSL